MTSLHDLPGLDSGRIRVLKEAGIETPGDFALMPPDLICRALQEGLAPDRNVPDLEEVKQMQVLVRRGAIPTGSAYRLSSPAKGLSVARALSSRQLMESGIEASAVPMARILGEPGEVQIEERTGAGDEAAAAPPPEQRRGPDAEPAPGAKAAGPPIMSKMPAQVVERTPGAKRRNDTGPRPEESNFVSTKERSREDKDFERKNRGMTHKDPGRVLRGALATLLSDLLVLGGFGTIATALCYELLTKSQVPASLAWGLLAFPAALLVFLFFATPPRCRLCGQRLFVPRQCRKHERAHKSFLGYTTSLALHVVCFGWFRCSLCGTKQKLK